MSFEQDRHQAMELYGLGPDDLEDFLADEEARPTVPLNGARHPGRTATSQVVELDLDAELEAHCVDFGD